MAGAAASAFSCSASWPKSTQVLRVLARHACRSAVVSSWAPCPDWSGMRRFGGHVFKAWKARAPHQMHFRSKR
jgi:hypothetical protein